MSPVRYPVVELRQYTLRPGQRDVLIELFDREFVESQEAAGMAIVGQFRDLDDPDRFVWIRGFASMPARAKALAAFYGGPVWKQHAAAANATMIDSDNVLLLRPATASAGFPACAAPRPPAAPLPAAAPLPPAGQPATAAAPPGRAAPCPPAASPVHPARHRSSAASLPAGHAVLPLPALRPGLHHVLRAGGPAAPRPKRRRSPGLAADRVRREHVPRAARP